MTPFPETIVALLEWRAAESPDAPLLFFEGDSWTRADTLGRARAAAGTLAERGVGRGDRVAMLLGNRPETLFTWFGANHLGAVAAPLNPASKPLELAAQLRTLDARVLVVGDGDVAACARAACDRLEPAERPDVVGVDDLARGDTHVARAEVAPGDVAVLLTTSGSTGLPKAVMQTHRAYTLTAEAFPWWLGLGPSDRLLAVLPLFHINAQAYSTMGALGAGASLALSAKFSASRFWADAARLGATEVNAVGAMLHILIRQPPSAAERAHAIRVCYSALALEERQHCAFEERFGMRLVVGYGLSETTFGTIWPRSGAPRYGSMGTLRQHPRLGVVSRARVVREDATDALADEPGELWLDNPAVMRGYWNDPAQTEAVLRDGWLRTGDLVRRDRDGFFTFVARKKDVIRRRGENIAAAEVENALVLHPDVLEAAVVARPSDLGEDDVVAYVVLAPGATLDVEALRGWVRERLADHKVPCEIRALDALPRTATERVAKHLLK